MKISVIVLLVVSALCSSANLSPINELDLINKAYSEMNSFQMNFTHTLYENKSMRKILEKKEGVYIKSNGNSYQRTLNSEVLITKGYHLLISHDERMISVGKYIVPKNVILNNLPNDFGSGLGNTKDIKVVKLDDSENELVMPGELGVYSELKLRYNTKSYLISAIYYNFSDNDMLKDIGFKEPPYLIVTCKNTKLNKNINNDIFNLKRFVIIKDKKVVPAPGFKTYKIYNNL